jgi:hypothetical protein
MHVWIVGFQRNVKRYQKAVDAVLELQRLHVKHANDIDVTMSTCGAHATVQTHPGAQASRYSLQSFLQSHGCCSCVEGKQGFFCVHHLLALSAHFKNLTRDFVSEKAILLAGSEFGTAKGCQLGPEGIVPLVQALSMVTNGENANPTSRQVVSDIVAAQTEQQAAVAVEVASDMNARVGGAKAIVLGRETAPMTPSKTLAQLAAIADAVSNAVTPVKQSLYALIDNVCAGVKGMVARPHLNDKLVDVGLLTAVRSVNTAARQEKRKLGRLEVFCSEPPKQKLAVGDAHAVQFMKPGVLSKASARQKWDENRPTKSMTARVERKIAKHRGRAEKEN